MKIDLDDLIPGSSWFRWREALWLPAWKIHVYPNETICNNIIYTARNVADPVRNLFGKPVQIHSWYRPELYNKAIGGAKASEHMFGKAIDFSIYTISLDEIHSVMEPRLPHLNIRMERPDGLPRVHCDWGTVPPGGNRYFNP